MAENIIAISYKDDHTDSCMGCVRDRFSSAFEINSGPEDKVLEKLVALDMNLEAADTCFDHYFVIEGCVVGYGEVHTPSGDFDNEELLEQVRERDSELREKLSALHTAFSERRKAEEEEKKVCAQRLKEAADRENELRRLRELKAKYPDA